MQVLVRAKDFSVTAAIQAFAEHEAGKVRKHAKRLIRIETFVEKTRAKTKATIKAVLPGKDVVVAHTADDLYQAIQEAFDRTARAVRKNSERLQDKRKRTHTKTLLSHAS